MSTYSNIKYSSLKNQASIALQELNNYSLDSIQTQLSSNDTLPDEIRKKVITNIKKINSDKGIIGSIASLKIKLNRLIKICNKVENYQDKEDEIRRFERSMDDDDSSDRKHLRKLKKELSQIKNEIDNELNKN